MNSVTQLRLDLLNNRYLPIPAHNKRAVLPGWPRVEITPNEIKSWETRFPTATTTAIRCGEVIAVDIDVDDEGLAWTLSAAAVERLGGAPVRRSVAGRRAMLYRTSERVVKRITGAFQRGEETAGVEIHGVVCLLNVAGPHSAGVEYRWDGDLPAMGTLTEVTEQALEDYLERARCLIAEAGYALVSPAVDAAVVRDITPEMVWSGMTTAELRAECERHDQVRVCMAAVRPGATNPQIGLASLCDDGTLLVYDFKTWTTHMEVDHTQEVLEELREVMAEAGMGPAAQVEPQVRFRGAVRDGGGDGGSGQAQRATTAGMEFPDAPVGRRAPRPTLRNIAAAITVGCGWAPRFNVMTGDGELWRGDEKLHMVQAMRHLEDELDAVHRMKDRNEVRKGVEILTRDLNVGYHPAADWIASKPWDGVNRLDTLARTVETDNAEHWHRIVQVWSLQVVQGVFGWRDPKPLELVPVLLGEQGIGKTSWIRALMPQPFVRDGAVLELGPMRKGTGLGDAARSALAQPITELGEIESTYRSSEITALKSFLSCATDTDRRPYQSFETTRPRVTSFIGTANSIAALYDDSGSRRFQPFECTRIHRHTVDTQQFWAQVWEQWKAGAQWWLTDADDAVRAARAGQFTDTPAEIEELRAELALLAKTLPTSEWSFANASSIAKTLGIYAGSIKTKKTITAWLNRNWHPRTSRVRGNWEGMVQEAWAVPIKAQGTIYPVSGATNLAHWEAEIAKILARCE